MSSQAGTDPFVIEQRWDLTYNHTADPVTAHFLRTLREKGIELDITDADRETLTHPVDFVSFSYYMSVCETADPATPAAPHQVDVGLPPPSRAVRSSQSLTSSIC